MTVPTDTTTPPLQRVMYAITGRSGQFLINTTADGPVFSPMPTEALATHHAWMASSTAMAKLMEVRALYPGIVLSLALLELESTTFGNWAVRSTQSFPVRQTEPETLIR